MADKSLIEANRRMLQSGRSPVVEFNAPQGNTLFEGHRAVNAARKNKIAAVNASVSNSMGKMKSDVDLTAYSKEEQKNIGKFLTGQRSLYANSANALAKISDASSPEYQYHVDVMNSVNNSFTNLKNQLDSYKENKIEFAEGIRTGLFSEGNDDMQYSNAAMMYGLVDGEKTNVPFEIAENGNLGFNMGGEYVSYNDFEQPFTKDYKVASGILGQSADLYKNHTLLQGPQKDMLRLSLMASLRDPNTIKSLVSDFESDGLNLSDIPLDDIDAARNMVADRIMNSYTDVAAQGKADYDVRHPGKRNGGATNSAGLNKDQTRAYGYFENQSSTLGMLSGGMTGMGYDADGEPVINADGELTGKPVVGYQIGKWVKNDIGERNFEIATGREMINIDDSQDEFLRKAGIK
jgi:hypothetical protein